MLKIIFNNPGLKHITENIFCNLRHEDLEVCRNIDQYCKKVLDERANVLAKKIHKKRPFHEKPIGLDKGNPVD